MDDKNRVSVNYLFFGALLALLVITSTCSVFMKENLIGSRLFFWFYSLGQSLLEVSILIFTGWQIHRILGRIAFWAFIGMTFLAFLFHSFDFMMDRILDVSVWETIGFVMDETFENFLFLLDASGIPLWAWSLFFSIGAALPIIGIITYKWTDWISRKKPLELPGTAFLQIFLCIPAALFFWDYSASRVIHPDAYTAFIKSLPWKCTFIQPKSVHWDTPPLTPPLSELAMQEGIASIDWKAEKKPNVFLFVVESLREDCITPKSAPHLSAFRDQNIHAQTALSNGNGSHISWFSIFHSQFPIYWSRLKSEHWNLGSPALTLFKKLGYKIHLYSSAQLGYYGMEHLIFGNNHELIDSYNAFHHHPPKQAYETDRQALEQLQSDLATKPELKEGNLFIIFWDSTHFDYSWPKDHPATFIPFAKEFAYFRAYQSNQNIEHIKNRYRNAIHYMDSLFGQFLSKADPEAVIAFTGDHGEEFFDHGHLFHGSHLTHEQTCVPLYFKVGNRNQQVPLMSQMDIMPTLLDAVFGQTTALLQGESVLRERQWPYALIARFNAGRTPYEFCFHNGDSKLIAQFPNRKDIFNSNSLDILSLRTSQDKSLLESSQEVSEWVEAEFGPAIDRLFPNFTN